MAHEEVNRLKNQLEAENIYLQQELQLDQTFGEMVGQSDALKYVHFKVNQVAMTDSTVLITGETGTGEGIGRPRYPWRQPAQASTADKSELRALYRRP